jgi:hypothetical protein
MAYKFNPFTGQFDDSPGLVTSTTAGLLPAGFSYEDDVFNVPGDINLDDGGSFTTTLQQVTPTAARTITFPDATGTVALVAGSTGQLTYNLNGAQQGLPTSSIDGSGNMTFSGRWIQSRNGAADAPPLSLTGTWFTGGTATTTKPHVLIEPAGTTSTAWSTSGTGLGVNAASGFTGNLLDLQVNGSQRIFGTSNGYLYVSPGNGSTNAHGLGFIGRSCGISSPLTDTFRIGRDNSADIYIGVTPANRYINLNGSFRFGWASLGADGGQDLSLFRDAANTLAQRNGTNPQAFRLYNTFTSATNFERLNVRWTSNEAILDTEAGGDGGTLRGLKIGSASTSLLGFYGATPVDQPAAVANATDTTDIVAQFNSLLARVRELGLIAT